MLHCTHPQIRIRIRTRVLSLCCIYSLFPVMDSSFATSSPRPTNATTRRSYHRSHRHNYQLRYSKRSTARASHVHSSHAQRALKTKMRRTKKTYSHSHAPTKKALKKRMWCRDFYRHQRGVDHKNISTQHKTQHTTLPHPPRLLLLTTLHMGDGGGGGGDNDSLFVYAGVRARIGFYWGRFSRDKQRIHPHARHSTQQFDK